MSRAVAIAILLGLVPPGSGPAMAQGHGENFSAKPAPALFASDCTGGGCHKGPQGLGRNQSQGSLASFLREHYTNSRESASALASYIMAVPRGAAPPAEPRAGRPQPGARASRASAQPEAVPSSTGLAKPEIRPEAKPEAKPDAKPETKIEAKTETKSETKSETGPEPGGLIRPETKPEAKPEPRPEPRSASRLQRGRHGAAASPEIAAPAHDAPAPTPAAPAAKPTPRHYDIFD